MYMSPSSPSSPHSTTSHAMTSRRMPRPGCFWPGIECLRERKVRRGFCRSTHSRKRTSIPGRLVRSRRNRISISSSVRSASPIQPDGVGILEMEVQLDRRLRESERSHLRQHAEPLEEQFNALCRVPTEQPARGHTATRLEGRQILRAQRPVRRGRQIPRAVPQQPVQFLRAPDQHIGVARRLYRSPRRQPAKEPGRVAPGVPTISATDGDGQRDLRAGRAYLRRSRIDPERASPRQ